MPDDLKIEIFVRQGETGEYAEVTVTKPRGMKLAEVIGWIEQAKIDLIIDGTVKEH